MQTGTIEYLQNNGSILTVVIKDDEGKLHYGNGDYRMTERALVGLFPDGIVEGESRVAFEMEDWGGLAFLGEG